MGPVREEELELPILRLQRRKVLDSLGHLRPSFVVLRKQTTSERKVEEIGRRGWGEGG
jgi:hypothetical protein